MRNVQPLKGKSVTRGVSLQIIVIATALLAALVPSAMLLGTVHHAAHDIVDELVTEKLRERADAAAGALAISLFNHWRDVGLAAAGIAPGDDPAKIRGIVEGAARNHEQYAWFGIASPDGKVIAANGGLLEGQDVSTRPWFREGLHGPFAGDVHEAVLLQRILQPDAKEPLRFVDFSLPLERNGKVFAVAGAHLNWTWVTSLFRTVMRGDADLMLVSRDGLVLVGPPDLQGKTLHFPRLRLAQQGGARSFLDVWPDGTQYFSAVTPSVRYRTLPSFGWSVVAREPASDAYAPLRTAVYQAVGMFVLGLGAMGLFALAIGHWVATPLLAIARRASAPEAASSPPTEDQANRYYEARQLADAVNRLQDRVPPARSDRDI